VHELSSPRLDWPMTWFVGKSTAYLTKYFQSQCPRYLHSASLLS